MSMEDLLKALMGDGAASEPGAKSSGDPLGDMLQGVLGGSGTKSTRGGGLEDILGAILGGTAGQGPAQEAQAGGLMDILGAILGGGASGQPAQVSPIIEGVTGKTGLSSTIVQMIISFVIGKLMGGLTGSAAGQGGFAPASGRTSPSSPEQESGMGLNLDGLLEQMGQDQGLVTELAQQTGLDQQAAQQGLQEVLGALGAQGREQGGLDSLLDSW